MKRLRRWYGAVRRLPGRLWRWLDWNERDIHWALGLLVLGVGLYGVDWRAALIAVGGLLVYVGLFHRRPESD